MIDVVIEGPVDTSLRDKVAEHVSGALGSAACTLSIPGLQDLSKQVEIPPKQKHINVSVSQSDDLPGAISQCLRLLANLNNKGELGTLDRIWLRMNGQPILIAPEALEQTAVRSYLALVYDDRTKELRPVGSAVSLDDYVFTAATVRNLLGGNPVAFSWRGQTYTLPRGKTPQQLIGEISYKP